MATRARKQTDFSDHPAPISGKTGATILGPTNPSREAENPDTMVPPVAGVLVALFVGATAGGVLLVHAPLYAPVLPFLITAAVVATAASVLRERDAADERAALTPYWPRALIGDS